MADNILQAFQLKRVSRWHEMVVVCDLDEGLDLGALVRLLLAHALCDLERVALNAGDEGVGERVGLGAGVLGLDNDDLYAGRREGVSMAPDSVSDVI